MSISRDCRISPAQAVAAALAASCLLLLAGCRERPTVPEADQGRAVADRFVEFVRTGKAAQAWDETSVEFKSAEGRDAFGRSVKRMPWLSKPVTFETVETIDSPLGIRAEYVYRSADAAHRLRLLIAPNGSEWCVDRMKVE